MICPKCGQETPDGSAFCQNCGYKLQTDIQPSDTADKNFGKGFQGDLKKHRFKKIYALIGAGAIVAIAAVIAIIVFRGSRPVKIRLDDYVSVDFSGYDTKGYASAVFDREAFYDDYSGKIKYETAETYKGQIEDDMACDMLLNMCVYGGLSQTSDLANGDTIEYVWSCDDTLAKEMFNADINYDTISFTVEGLDDTSAVNPFDSIEVVYSGTAPYGAASVNVLSNEDYLGSLQFTVSPQGGLSNGDTVTVSISNLDGSLEDSLVQNYGITLDETQTSYTVEGLSEYVTSLDQISEDTLAKMQSQSEDVMRAEAARRSADNASLDQMTYAGSYLLSAKNPDSGYGEYNMLYLVYQLESSIRYEEEDITDSFSYYYTVRFDDLIANTDGTVTVDLSNYSTTSDSFRHTVQYGEESYEQDTYYVYGYETIDSAFNECVAVNMDTYNYQSSMDEEASESE